MKALWLAVQLLGGPANTNTNTNTKTKTNTNTNTKSDPRDFMTFETFDQRDDETRPDQQKENDKDKDNDKDIQRTPSKSDPRDFVFDQRDEET